MISGKRIQYQKADHSPVKGLAGATNRLTEVKLFIYILLWDIDF